MWHFEENHKIVNSVYYFQPISPVLLLLATVKHLKYCIMRKFSWIKFSLIRSSKIVRSCNFHYPMAVHFYIINKVNILETFNFHTFASSVEIAKIKHRWNFLVLQYTYNAVCWPHMSGYTLETQYILNNTEKREILQDLIMTPIKSRVWLGF